MTTVTISDKLRQKLKQLAAKYDTTQAEIIKKAIELFERNEHQLNIEQARRIKIGKNEFLEKSDNTRKIKIEKVLSEAIAKFESKYPEIAKRRQKLQQDLYLLDEVTIANWALPFEE